MDRTASEIKKLTATTLITTAMDAGDISSATSAKLENATLECQQFLATIALCYQCERVSFEHQLLQCCWDIVLEIELS